MSKDKYSPVVVRKMNILHLHHCFICMVKTNKNQKNWDIVTKIEFKAIINSIRKYLLSDKGGNNMLEILTGEASKGCIEKMIQNY